MKKTLFTIVAVAFLFTILFQFLPTEWMDGVGIIIVGTLILSPVALLIVWVIEFFRKKKGT
ncbi:MAG TPA: hypothetical protein PK109_01630 [Candidatus Paceibacterota bacterium]|nr:hypothetical protein [Candidatus Paceibacterota bacterium]